MSLKKNIILSVVVFLTAFFSFTQTEEEVRAKADALFKNKEYVEATPLYLRLLSLQPKSYDYSYKYGTCLLFNSNSKQDAIRYLTYAIKSPEIIPESHFFLGKAYHLNYQFNDAIREYKNYLTKAGPKGEYTAESNRNIEMCENGKNLLTTITDVIVRKKTEIKQDDFFRLYDLSEIGGSIIIAINFQSKNDKKFNHKPVVHISPNMENVYFSSYGDGNNLDIYVARRLPGGKFGVPQKINGGVNTPFDEDFPYMHPNGRELYFSSKGHNSMGGYDIFRATFNPDNNTFGDVTNVDFSISSPDDDILYVVDKESKNAYFSSRRQSQDGKIVVYKVGVERIPVQLAIVKGTFHSSILPDQPKMTVEVFDKTNGKRIGVFNTLKESSYLITFPKGGRYEYKITIDGSEEQFTADVEIPYLKELRPLKQRIDHELIEAKERIRITNLFNEDFEDAQSIVSQVLKERANLNVNEDQFDSEELESEAKTRVIIAELRLGNRSLMEVGQLLELKAAALNTAADGGNKIESASNGISIALYNEIIAIDNEIKDLVKEADASESSRRKELVLSNAKELYQLREEKQQKIQQVQKETGELSTNIPGTSPQDSKKLAQISKEYNQLFNEGKNNEIRALLEEHKDYLVKVLNTQSSSGSEDLLKKRSAIDSEIKRLQSLEQVHIEEIKRLDSEIAALKEQKDRAKEKLKQDVQDKIDDKLQQSADNESSLSKVRALISKEAEKRDEITQKLTVVSEIENYTGKTASKEELEKTKALINEDKSRTLRSYIESSLEELSGRPAAESTETIVEKTIDQYNTLSEEIYANPEWSDYEKQNRLLALNAEKKQELTSYIGEIEGNDSLDENEKRQQKAAAQKMISQLDEDQTSLKKEFDNTSKKEIANLKTENIISDVYPDYQNRTAQIKGDGDLSEIERLEQSNQLDKELTQKITAAIQQLKNSQVPGTEHPLAAAKTELLEKHLEHVQSTISSRNQEINQLRAVQENSIKQQQETEKQINRIAEIAEEKYNLGITAYKKQPNTGDPGQQISILADLSRELNSQKQELKNIKQAHPENTAIDDQLVIIENRIDELSVLLANEKTALEALNNQKNETVPQPPAKTHNEIAREIQSYYPGNAQNDFEVSQQSIRDIRENIRRLEKYEAQLKQRLSEAQSLEDEQEKQVYQAVINQEITRTQARINILGEQEQEIRQSATENQEIAPEKIPPPVKSGDEAMREIQSSYSGNIRDDFEKPQQDIRENIQRLEQYTVNLEQRLKETGSLINEEERQIYQEAINREISRVQNRIEELEERKKEITLNEIADQDQPIPDTISDDITREQEISSLLLDPGISKNERKRLNNELLAIRQQKAIENTAQKQHDNAQLEERIKAIQQNSSPETKSISTITKQYTNERNRLSAELAREKNPINQEITAAQIELLNRQYYNDLERSVRLGENTSIAAESSEARIYSREQLQNMKRRGIIEIDEITLLKMEKNKHYSTASKKEKENIRQEIATLEEREDLIRKELAFIDVQLRLYNPIERPEALDKNDVQLTYNEELRIAASESYQHYAKAISTQNELISKHSNLANELAHSQRQLEEIRALKAGPIENRSSFVQKKQEIVGKIKYISLSLNELETEISNVSKEATAYLPTDPDEMMKFQNLVMRGVNPIKKSLVATALIPISASGIEFNPAAPAIPELKTIPVGVTAPKGLVYRVQVGAFARPVPEDHFKEFSPVSGEKIENTNITRYMAGYFNNASSVVEARDKIKQIGYSDAFIVAYCDGKRITFGEARRLEERNECIGQRANDLQLEVATNFAQKLGLEDTSKTIKPVPEWSYNQSPRSAAATAIEQFDNGFLFYTVQIGVYNRPVEKENLLYLEPLYTLRLENGQIRYSVGIYGDLSQAKQLESEIREKGISDAFVTAYYQGKRISVDKAGMLLSSGIAQLYTGEDKIIGSETKPAAQTITEIEVFTENKMAAQNEHPAVKYIQFVTKETFENYPREELNRYNAKGSFYFDQADKRIKSSFYPDTELLPRIAAFSEQLDTLYFSKSEVLKSNDSKVTFLLNSASVPGDLNDWLMKFPYRKSVTRSENGIEIHIFDVRLEDVREMKAIAELFAYPLIETQNTKEYDGNGK